MAKELVTMSTEEIDRVEVVRGVLERRLTQKKAGEILGLTARQVRRLCAAYGREGPQGLVSRKRGRPSNRQLPDEFRTQTVGLVRELYGDFGLKLAHEKLAELHGVRVARETLRKWMTAAGLWLTRAQRAPKAHQPRRRRECFGELVQIDGCEHAWFEGRGLECSLLVYVDDATSRLMEMRFVKSESAFDYFASTTAYLLRHGKPVAFYSDKHSVFRVSKEGATGRARGMTQFGRALAELNIEIICANSPQAKGRVERMNKTLQDRLVKELRLRGISTMEGGNAFVPEFMNDYNRRFAREPRNPHDVHRPLQVQEDLSQIFSWQEERTMSRNLTVQFKRGTYLVEPNPQTLALGGKRVRVQEWADGRVEIYCQGQRLPYSLFDQNPNVNQGAIVENKRLGAALAAIAALQFERDQVRLASKKLTLREKERISTAREQAGRLPLAPGAGGTAFAAFLRQFTQEQKQKQKRYNDAAKVRRAQALEARLTAGVPRPSTRSRAQPTSYQSPPAPPSAPPPATPTTATA